MYRFLIEEILELWGLQIRESWLSTSWRLRSLKATNELMARILWHLTCRLRSDAADWIGEQNPKYQTCLLESGINRSSRQ